MQNDVPESYIYIPHQLRAGGRAEGRKGASGRKRMNGEKGGGEQTDGRE